MNDFQNMPIQAIPRYVQERSFVASTISEIVSNFPIVHNTTYPGFTEHCYDQYSLAHNFNIHMEPETGWWRLLVEHPPLCGCDALTDELVLHG